LASRPDTKRFCADALELIRIAAPKAAMLITCLVRLKANLQLVFLSFVFTVFPLWIFCWLGWSQR
jgi:hypothetical protein